jgi:hypothetical protein
MTRQFLDVEGIEIEVSINANGKYFVRHEFYWWLKHEQKTTEADYNNTIRHLQSWLLGLSTIKWSGYKFRLETIVFSEDDVEVESILLPLAMFEDLLKDTSRFSNQLREEIQSGEYKPKPNDKASIKLCVWLQSNSLSSLLQTDNR